MVVRFYEIAGLRLRVAGPAQDMYQQDGILAAFAAAGDEWDHSLEFSVTETISPPEGEQIYRDYDKQIYHLGDGQLRYGGAVERSWENAYLRIERRGNRSVVQVLRSQIPYGIPYKLVMNCMEAEHLVSATGGFLLHASCICHQGKAILFTAPSGTGKSTQAALWGEYRGAELINGDRAAVFYNNGQVEVRGIPFCGSSTVAKNVTLPVAAIVYLSQAPATTITRLSGVRAFRKIWEGCSVNVWNPEDMNSTTQAVMDTVSTVPIFHLACTPDESAVEALEGVCGL